VSLVAWRFVQRRFVKDAFTGEGARRFGGRWNSPGYAAVYTAQSQALAALEILVHFDSDGALRNYVAIPVTMEENLITRLDGASLPRNWRAYPAPRATRLLGDEWIVEQKSAVLQVPSVVIPAESNYLLNPIHPDFRKLVLGTPTSFKFDRRLAKGV
jgi:RES domain-containing protein